jgi:uncharacterized protein (TIGR00288 family)
MNDAPDSNETRVAVLVDCDNTSPEILEHALRVVAQFGRVVLRRGYGNHNTLANKWQEALVRLAFTPCLQYQYAAGKSTADIALALDAMEAMFDGRADTFCLVTSDSDFAYLCRKLPVAPAPVAVSVEKVVSKAAAAKVEQHKTAAKLRPKFVIQAVDLLAGDTPEGKVGLGPLGAYLKRTDPAFSPQAYNHSGLLDMIRTYDLLVAQQEPGGHWSVKLAPKKDAVPGQVSLGAADH